jgi:hypothetical protein
MELIIMSLNQIFWVAGLIAILGVIGGLIAEIWF